MNDIIKRFPALSKCHSHFCKLGTMLAFRAKNTTFPFWEYDIFACRGRIPEPLKSVANRSLFLSRFASAVFLPEMKKHTAAEVRPPCVFCYFRIFANDRNILSVCSQRRS